MPKGQNKLNLSRQKRALLALEWASGFRPAGSIWVLLLALRGFSLVEVGLAESLFHVVSLWGEVPSGLLADLLGRKRTLLLSQAMFVLSALMMAASGGLAGVCLSLAASALAYNLQSGTREAITYESMLQAGREEGYLKFSSLQNSLYRLSDGGAMLLAGATVLLGWRFAYLIDAAIAAVGFGAVLALAEPETGRTAKRPLSFSAALARGTRLPALMAAGLLAGLLDDALQLVSDKRLNSRFPSAARATLVSVSSMAFSLAMIPLSPLLGWFFS